MFVDHAEFAHIDSVLKTKLIGHFSLRTFAQTHFGKEIGTKKANFLPMSSDDVGIEKKDTWENVKSGKTFKNNIKFKY